MVTDLTWSRNKNIFFYIFLLIFLIYKLSNKLLMRHNFMFVEDYGYGRCVKNCKCFRIIYLSEIICVQHAIEEIFKDCRLKYLAVTIQLLNILSKR